MAMTPLGGGGKANAYKPLAEINITPFVDVMLVLLIIFMVAAPLMITGVPLELPKTAAAKVGQPKKPVILSMTPSGDLYHERTLIPAGNAMPQLMALRQEVGDAVVYVRADRGLGYGQVMEVLGLVGQAGFARVSLIAEAPAGGAGG